MRSVSLIVMSCSLAGCGLEDQRQGMIAANISAIEEARKIQAEIAEAGKCPERLVGWERKGDTPFHDELVHVAGTTKVQYTMSFECYENLAFGITVKYSFDSGTGVSGSATGPLEIVYGHFTKPCTIEIRAADDAAVVATRVVREQCT